METVKRNWIFQLVYYIFVPTAFVLLCKMASFLFEMSGRYENIGAVILFTNGILFLFLPVLIVCLMRLSLLRWFVDPFAAAEIPVLLYAGMIGKQISRGHTVGEAFCLVNRSLGRDCEGFLYLAGLFLFGIVCSFSVERTKGNSVSYKILRRLEPKARKKL